MKTQRLIEALKQKNMHICCAESCTGGMLSSALVGVAGASDVIDMGLVTYANSAKIKLLDVDPADIEKYGVVSEEVTGQMARGACAISGAEVGVGISGIAGPGGSDFKPEGMVCFGFCINGSVTTATVQFGAIGRQSVRESSVEYAIDTLISKIAEI